MRMESKLDEIIKEFATALDFADYDRLIEAKSALKKLVMECVPEIELLHYGSNSPVEIYDEKTGWNKARTQMLQAIEERFK